MSGNQFDEAIKRAMTQGKAGQLQVAAPLNDAQLLSIVAAVVWHGMGCKPEAGTDAMQSSMSIIANSVVAVRSGLLNKAIAEAMEKVSGGEPTQPNGSPLV